MMNNDLKAGKYNERRRFLRVCRTTAIAIGGMQMLSACEDDVVGAENVPVSPTATPSAAASPPPAYTATDMDRINFVLQLHYLLANYVQGGITGSVLASSLTAGSGTPGAASGVSLVTLTDRVLASRLREIADGLQAQIGWLRRTAGSAVAAQPAINLAGGQGSPFQAIAVTPGTTTATTDVFNPYASENDFLLGAIALAGVVATATAEMTRLMAPSLAAPLIGLASAAGAHEASVRSALFVRALAQAALPAAQRPSP